MARLNLICAGAILALALAGCATEAQKEARRVLALLHGSTEEVRACADAIKAKPRYAHLYEKFGIGWAASPSAVQLADQATITDQDAALGLDWYAERQKCLNIEIQDLVRIDPELGIMQTNLAQQEVAILTWMVKTRPSYGAVNEQIQKLHDRAQAEAKAWTQRLGARLQAQHQQELQEREQFWSEVGAVTENVAKAALAAVVVLAQAQANMRQAQITYVQSHPSYVPAARITTVNCQWIGSIWSCVQF